MSSEPDLAFLKEATEIANLAVRRGGDNKEQIALALVCFAVGLAGDDTEVRRQLGIQMLQYAHELLPGLDTGIVGRA